ncbi:conserved exported hypothetical protein [Candidatus Sulfopaludibacter sp. SbA3]|nr:conserved exported hypothetical protein [Candidatus Sulfopaludibacter sp. SbA3]
MHRRPLALLLLIPILVFGKDSVPRLRSIQVAPGDFALIGRWASQRILVTGQLAAGGIRDVTGQTQFKSANGKIAKVGKSGIVTPVADGETTISLSVGGQKQKLHVTVRDSRQNLASFLQTVEPLLANQGCNSAQCHGAAGGKGSLKLSLFSGEPAADYDALTRAAGGRRIDRVDPSQSLIFLKATGALPHPGAPVLKPGTAEYETLLAWLERGASYRVDQEPQIVSLKLYPESRTLQKGETQRLMATVVFSDGRLQDVTTGATFRSSDPKVATVDAATVKATGTGDAAIVVIYQRKAAVLRLAVPQTGPKPFPGFSAGNPIDAFVYAKLKTMGIPPSGLSTDAEFLRRVYLDVIGILPTAAEARTFLTSTDPDRRTKLIDSLLARDEFADFWSLKWGDLLRIKSEFPVRLWPKAVAVYYEWVHESIAQNKPYDQFARELLTATGSNFRDAAVNFMRANPTHDARTLGETAALVFMGARMGCAHCHSHPQESWTPDDDLALGSFFGRVGFKSTVEWKEEIVYPDFKLSLRNPRTRQVVPPQIPGGKPLPVGPEEDPRTQFANWLTAPGNPWFSANIVNRIWFWLMGRGIVNEPDDLRSTNPPTNPELLSYLQEELRTHKYDLRHIYGLILNSRTYQLSSQPNEWNAADTTHFSHYLVKRLSAEQMLDAVSQFTETNEKFRSIIPEPFSNWPANYRATQISDGNTECSFLDLFGRASRDMPYEADRDSDLTLRQTLYFLNSEQLEGKISNSPHLKRLLAATKPDSEIVDEIYLTTLSRLPTADERKRLLDYLATKKTARAQAVQDVAWAVLNAKEFLFNH